jgi:Terminase DNA packaging enzyme
MTANNDPVWNALGVTPPAKTENVVATIVASAKDDSAMTDFNLARSNIHEVIQNGSHAIDRLSQIADASQHPRAFEVLATLLKVQLDANKDLMELQKKIRDIQAADEPHNEEAKQVTNNLFVGSTSELQKMIENMKNGTNDKVV